ncbi:LPXTG cell wall anchor domain-containing protein [Arsenicicoccus sp. oral taxon 190]|uniref:LPXTG cell wall anchor domain-containing protein n=1 Tax=Arsenicicoccus sp. oral taxon 190 TaxID=1658671 RepID=UPI00067A3D3A|nr:LPXTG cell wall anchor domain-containing protein [Arsenicicoccus sp. oral taxon 190]AKT51118.1 hypothetical protein ADJ73_06945 [Arsenicicoccus sp. oral taxon 190]
MTRRARAAAAALGIAATTLTPLTSGSTAAALGTPRPTGAVVASNELVYLRVSSSPNGPWGSTLAGGIFPAGHRIAPGKPVTGTFYVKNASPDTAVLSLSSLPDPLASEGKVANLLRVAAGIDGPAAPSATDPTVAALSTTATELATATVAPGRVVRVELAALLPSSTRSAEGEDCVWDTPITVSLAMAPSTGDKGIPSPVSPAVPGEGAAPGREPSGGAHRQGQAGGARASRGTRNAAPDAFSSASSPLAGALAHTGAEVIVLLLAGGGATALGILLLVLARRRRRDDDAAPAPADAP